MGGEPITQACWAARSGIWIIRPDPIMEGSKASSFPRYERLFWSCIASDFVARWGFVWKVEGDGCAIGVVAAWFHLTGTSMSAGYRVEASYALNSDEPGICDQDAETLCGCGVMGK